MKKIILSLFAAISLLNANAQTVILSENFTSYDGTAATVPAGWVFNFNSNYTSTTSSGPSGPNSYKFGIDTATIITPAFNNGDTLKFWYKGNSADSASALEILTTDDFNTWSTLATLNPIANTSGGFMASYPITHTVKQIKFIYHKSVGNCAFDDFSIVSNATAVKNISKNDRPFTISPNPSNGPVTIDFMDKLSAEPQFSIFNMIGSEIKDVNFEKVGPQSYRIKLNHPQPGFYFIRVKTNKSIYTQRFTITAMAIPAKVSGVNA